ncbi:MAG TPA: ABC transporter substrate-binding protein [Aggregatilineales bacterium]|nr:ABC transporter substrate-binding protein [Aggregatilineales bacterium]
MAASVRGLMLLLAALIVTGCAGGRDPLRVALLAPFEGRYREVGYDLLYAVRLGLADAPQGRALSLLAVDDGGTSDTALMRAQALVRDSSVRAVLVAGYAATDARVLEAFAGLPVIVIGGWGVGDPPDGVFVLASADIATARAEVTALARQASPLTGGEALALKQFPGLRESLDGVTVISSASPADDAFAQRLIASDRFVEPPGLLSTLAYDAAGLLAGVPTAMPDRAAAVNALNAVSYDGINGTIRFADGFWQDAPVYRYMYDTNGALVLTD